MTEQGVFWVGVGGMALGAALFLVMARGTSKESAPHYAVHIPRPGLRCHQLPGAGSRSG